jgi:catechol 2,3-dioxygenase-like lactoylglutathione lyase family enzyme
MHRSRLSTVVIDCAEEDFERGVEFWSRALGKARVPEAQPRYVTLRGRLGGEGGPYVLLQRVPKPERAVHLDFETDDVEREVARLEALGARVKARIRNHVVMLAPSGHAFCVVPTGRRGDFPGDAATWD